MKTYRRQRWTAMAVAAGVLIGTGLARAADPAPQREPAARGERGVAARRAQAQAMAKELNLSEEQKTRVTDLLKKQAEKARALRDDAALTQAQRREKARTLREELVPEMKKILTAEQMEQWQKLRREQATQRRANAGQEKVPAK